MDQQPPQYPPSGPQPPYYQGPQPPQYPLSGSQPFPYQEQGPQPPYYQPMMPPPPPKKRNGWLIGIIVGVVVLLVVCSALGFFVIRAVGQTASNINGTATTIISSITPQATSQSTPQATPQSPSQSSHHQVGETIVADATWTVTVHGVKTSQGSDFEKPDAGKIYLLIDTSVKNTSSQTQIISSLLQFTLRDASGQQVNEAIVTFAPNAPNGNVETSGLIRGTLAYQVPSGTNTYTLAFDPSLTTQTTVIWDIHVA